MKRTIILILSLFFLFACTNEDRQTEEINKLDCVIKTERVTLKYKTIDEDNNVIDSKEDQEVEMITEGKDGYKDIVYCDDKVLNEWVYETATHEVVKVGIKKEVVNELPDSQTSGSGEGATADGSTSGDGANTGGGYTPPATGGGNTTQPPTEPPYPVNGLANSGLLFDTEAEAWNEFYRILESEDLSKQYGAKIGITTNGGYVVGGSVVSVKMSYGSKKYSIEFY